MATEDILINDGDGFISLSELATEQVDVELPISSADGKVKLIRRKLAFIRLK